MTESYARGAPQCEWGRGVCWGAWSAGQHASGGGREGNGGYAWRRRVNGDSSRCVVQEG